MQSSLLKKTIAQGVHRKKWYLSMGNISMGNMVHSVGQSCSQPSAAVPVWKTAVQRDEACARAAEA